MNIYVYSVKWYSEVDEKYIFSSGLVSGESIGSAVAKLENEYFKNEDVASVSIHVLDGSSSGVVSLTEFKDAIEKLNLIDE
jgi:hypothetical protein